MFPTLTVRENLVATARRRGRSSAWTLDRVLAGDPECETAIVEAAKELGDSFVGGLPYLLLVLVLTAFAASPAR